MRLRDDATGWRRWLYNVIHALFDSIGLLREVMIDFRIFQDDSGMLGQYREIFEPAVVAI